jgi:hypothetical protein
MRIRTLDSERERTRSLASRSNFIALVILSFLASSSEFIIRVESVEVDCVEADVSFVFVAELVLVDLGVVVAGVE